MSSASVPAKRRRPRGPPGHRPGRRRGPRRAALRQPAPTPPIEAINATLCSPQGHLLPRPDHLDDAEQERFAARLGQAGAASDAPARPRARRSILELDSGSGGGRADQWHTDVTFVDAYPKISVLRGVVIPPVGGDTVWSNTAAAYRGPAAAAAAARRRALGGAQQRLRLCRRRPRADRGRATSTTRRSSPRRSTRPSIRSSASIRKPASARWCSAISCSASSACPKDDGQQLFDLFQSTSRAPENTVRWSWQARRRGDLGQPRHPALRGQRLRRPAPRRAPRHHRWRRAGQRRRPPQRFAQEGGAPEPAARAA